MSDSLPPEWDVAGPLVGYRLAQLEATLRDLERGQLSPEKIADQIRVALEKSQARGWTSRERTMGVVLFATTIATFVLNLAKLL